MGKNIKEIETKEIAVLNEDYKAMKKGDIIIIIYKQSDFGITRTFLHKKTNCLLTGFLISYRLIKPLHNEYI